MGATGVQHFQAPAPPVFHTATKKQLVINPSKRFIAVEIEVATTDSGSPDTIGPAVKKWHGAIVGDGSLPSTGFEINTAPASGDLFVQQVEEICQGIADKRGAVDGSCGLHVHVDARDFNYYDIRKLVTVYQKIEPALFDIVAASRKSSHYCAPCGDKLSRNLDKALAPKDNEKQIVKNIYGDAAESARQYGRDKYNSSRYAALNLHSWVYRGTVECRMHQGSVNFHKISNWGILWAGILDYAYNNSEHDLRALKGEPMSVLLSVCPTDATREWVVSRYTHFQSLNKK